MLSIAFHTLNTEKLNKSNMLYINTWKKAL